MTRRANEFQVEFIKGGTNTIRPRYYEVELQEEKNMKSATITCEFFNHSQLSPIQANDEVVVRDLTNSRLLYKGIVLDIARKKEGKKIIYTFDTASEWIKSQNVLVNKKWENVVLSQVVEDIINDTSAKTGYTAGIISQTDFAVEYYEVGDESLFDSLNKLEELLGFHLDIDETNKKIHFKKHEEGTSKRSLEKSNIIYGTSDFQKNFSKIVNHIIATGKDNLRVVVEDKTSQAQFGLKMDVVNFSELETKNDLIEAATRHLNTYKNEIWQGTAEVMKRYDWEPNDRIKVNLPELGIHNEILRITSISSVISEGFVQTTVAFNEEPRMTKTITQLINLLRKMKKDEEDKYGELKLVEGWLGFDKKQAEAELEEEKENPDAPPRKSLWDRILELEEKTEGSGNEEDVFTPEGTGTMDDPFQIKTPEHLIFMAEQSVVQDKNLVFSILNDIDLSGKIWVPIGVKHKTPFRHRIYGNGHSIKNIIFKAPNLLPYPEENFASFIYHLTGRIEDLHLVVDLTAQFAAPFAIKITGDAQIRSCSAKGTIKGDKIAGFVLEIGETIQPHMTNILSFCYLKANANGTAAAFGFKSIKSENTRSFSLERGIFAGKIDSTNKGIVKADPFEPSKYEVKDIYVLEGSFSNSIIHENIKKITPSEAFTSSTFRNFKFGEDWGIHEGLGLPYLLTNHILEKSRFGQFHWYF